MNQFDNTDGTRDVWFVLEPMVWEEVTRADRLHGSPIMPLPDDFRRRRWLDLAGVCKATSALPCATRADVLLAEVYELIAAEPGSANQMDEAAQVIAGVIRLIAEQNHREQEEDE